MKHFFKIISVLVIFFSAVFAEQGNCMAQKNLVPNWSFEEYNSCPDFATQSCHAPSLVIPSLFNWGCAINFESTSDYFNSCTSFPLFSTPLNFWGNQDPKTGNAYAGICVHSNHNNSVANLEYLQTKLMDTLKINLKYCVSFYVSRADNQDFASSNFGAYFSNNMIVGVGLIPHLNYSPQVKNPFGNFIKDYILWNKISGSFIANGSEAYITLGSFGNDHLFDTLYDPKLPIDPVGIYDFSYYFIDDVSVEEVLNADAGSNQTIACGDSVRIGLDSAWAANYTWEPSTGLVNAKVPMPIAHPTITTTYTVTKQQCEVITTSTVTVFVTNDCPYINYLDEFMIPNVFTPNGDNSNDVWQFTLGLGNNLKSLHIYDRWGLEVKSSQMQTQNFIKWDGYTTTGEPCTAGVYFYTLEYSNVLGEQNKVNGYITLMK